MDKNLQQTPNLLALVETLFKQYYPRLSDFALRFVVDEDVAEDIVQDVFARLCEHHVQLPKANPAIKNFLYTSVKNACLNNLRHLQVVNNYTEAAKEMDTHQESSLEHIIHSEMVAALFEAIEALPAGCSLILRKGFLDGLKNHEIAAELGISINTVRSQKQRAIGLLKEQLTPGMAHIILPLLALFEKISI